MFSEFATDTVDSSTISAAVELELGCTELSNKGGVWTKFFCLSLNLLIYNT